ncbi:DoxX family membrane protein [Weissella sagaensis]|uniref:DoxX family membrane protein n=1 Tax=Weissella sagaensis TaxID=2559928 RepID=A0ABW1RR69_9LACO|nr:DoxX family membrane protein [Weissella sagaensis]MBU7568841.1 DoxX family membrane protein [Weissella hellenica]QDJ58030.1 DoxX family membrane protein [Weissella hellenica]QEA57029.1 DoxX family membrane protein [Weissella hellenica]UEG66138.1 DoxX family membrane protein [Weissella hellenica]
MVNWLRNSKSSMVVLTLIRLYVGYVWLTSGWSKISSGNFTSEAMVQQAIKTPVTGATGAPAYDWYTKFLENIVQPNLGIFDFMVQYGELLIGLGLIFGTLTTLATFFGLGLNFNYLLAGMISTNPILIILGTLLLVAGLNAGKIGGDRWVIPFIREKVPFMAKNKRNIA